MQFLKSDWIVQYGLPHPLQNSWVPKVKLTDLLDVWLQKASCIPFSTMSERIWFRSQWWIPKIPKLRKDKNVFLSLMKDKVLWSCAGAPGVRVQVLPLIVLTCETLISWSHYCQCWLLQLQTLHLHSRMKGKRRKEPSSRDVWKCLEATSQKWCTALQTMSHGSQFSLMTSSSCRAS